MSAEINSAQSEKKGARPRPNRFVSHALVEVRKFKSIPLFCHSAVLLDISLSGYKIEFTSEVRMDPGIKCWLNIPLSPLGIYAPKRLLVHSECRWFDSHRFRIGGVFISLSKQEMMLIEQIIATIQSRKES